ncbi:MAG: hypothetical protein ACOH2A_12405 [Sphingobacteriaceae bacterium]
MSNSVKKICIITPGILASNPRAVKEAEALSVAGYMVHVIYTRHVSYLLATDQAILDEHPEWTFDYLDWAGNNPKARFNKIVSGLKKRIATILFKNKLFNKKNIPFLTNRFYCWQLKKAIAAKADLYIAHYPESLVIAAGAAKINHVAFAFDAEDYHRGENLPAAVLQSIEITEDQFLPGASYISAASPLISVAYQKLYPKVPMTSVENVFPLTRQPAFQEVNSNPFKFFWFSQTIGHGRGLEAFIAILGQTKNQDVQLTLLGNVQTNYKDLLASLWLEAGLMRDLLVFINTVPEKEIFVLASQQHFGLCLEIPSVLNKDFCLSNKLYTYLLSGNYLICSKTSAQENFLNEHTGTGLLIDLNDIAGSAEKLLQILNSPANIQHTRLNNYKLGQTALNYDVEKKRLLDQVSKVV